MSLQHELTSLSPTALRAAYEARRAHAPEVDRDALLEADETHYSSLVWLIDHLIQDYADELGMPVPDDISQARPEILSFAFGAMAVVETLIQQAETQAMEQQTGLGGQPS